MYFSNSLVQNIFYNIANSLLFHRVYIHMLLDCEFLCRFIFFRIYLKKKRKIRIFLVKNYVGLLSHFLFYKLSFVHRYTYVVYNNSN